VPVWPLRPSTSWSSEVIRVLRPGPDVVNRMAARILGSIEPSANWPSAMYFSTSATVTSLRSCWVGVLKLMATFSTPVRMAMASH